MSALQMETAMKFETLARKVEDCLLHAPSCVCDSCVARKVGGMELGRVRNVTRRIGQSQTGSRYTGRCSECGRTTVVTVMNSVSM